MNIRELLIKVGFDSGNTVQELNRVDKATDNVKAGFSALNGVFAALFTGGALMKLVNVADAMQGLQAQIGNSTNDMEHANQKFNELADHANQTRTSIDAYVGSWAKMNQGITRFGGTTEDTTKFVDTLSAAFKVNGTANESANAALFQLSQTMQSGVVQGEEMNSFLDAQGTLANEVMTAIGGTVPQYKKMQQAGQVTAKMLMDAVNKQYPKYIAMLEKTPRTMADVWTQVTNDVSQGINNINNSAKLIPRMAGTAIKWWNAMKKSVIDFVDETGGLDAFAEHVMNMVKPLGLLLGAFMAFKALSFLTTPIGLILGLASAIGILYDDYQTWKQGGESLINWGEWQGPIEDTLTALNELKNGFLGLTAAAADLLQIDMSKWTLKGELQDLAYHMRELVYMGQQLADMLNGLADLDWQKIKTAGANLWNQGKPGSEMPAQTPFAQDEGPAPKVPVTTRRPSWWPEALGGPGEITNLDQVTKPLAPGNIPSNVVNNNTQTTNAPVTNTFNITQQPGENGEAFAQRIAQLTRSQSTNFDSHNLLMTGGAQ